MARSKKRLGPGFWTREMLGPDIIDDIVVQTSSAPRAQPVVDHDVTSGLTSRPRQARSSQANQPDLSSSSGAPAKPTEHPSGPPAPHRDHFVRFARVSWASFDTLRSCQVIGAALVLRVAFPRTWVDRVLATDCQRYGCYGAPGHNCTRPDSVDRHHVAYHHERWAEPTAEELCELEQLIRQGASDLNDQTPIAR